MPELANRPRQPWDDDDGWMDGCALLAVGIVWEPPCGHREADVLPLPPLILILILPSSVHHPQMEVNAACLLRLWRQGCSNHALPPLTFPPVTQLETTAMRVPLLALGSGLEHTIGFGVWR